MRLFSTVFFLFLFLFVGCTLEAQAQVTLQSTAQDLSLILKKVEDVKPVLKFQPVMVWDLQIKNVAKTNPIKDLKKSIANSRIGSTIGAPFKGYEGDGFKVKADIKYNFKNGNYRFKVTASAEPRIIIGLGKKIGGWIF